MYYLVHDNSNESIYIKYFIDKISREDFSESFELYITDNMQEDFSKFDGRLINNPSGVVILPEYQSKFIILISKESNISTYLHELTHAYDTYLFKKHFDIKNNVKVRSHKYFKTLSFWSEYHAEIIELKYSKLFYKHILENNIDDFTYIKNNITQAQIDAWKNVVNQYCCTSFHGVMYLFALINFAKSYIPDILFNETENITIPWEFYDLLSVLKKTKDFSDFLTHIDELYELISPLPLD